MCASFFGVCVEGDLRGVGNQMVLLDPIGAIVSGSVIPWTQTFAWVLSCGKAYGQLAAGLLCASS